MQYKKPLFFLLLTGYALLYTATSKQVPCDDDCEKTGRVFQQLSTNRTYVYGVYRCTQPRPSDTLCVLVRDTSGINWNMFADTACKIATQQGLLQQKIFILKNGTNPYDTLAKKLCL